MTMLWVAAGAAVGAPLRYLAGILLDGRWPWGTLAVNLAGSLILGWLVGLDLRGAPLALLGTGFCGALTTYSTFAVQVHERGRRLGSALAATTLAASLALCAVGFWLGAR